MQRRLSIASVAALGLLVVGCGSGPPDRPDARETSPTLSSPTATQIHPSDNSTSTRPRPSRPSKPEPTSSKPRPPLSVLIATLRQAGATSVGQAEPPHGSEFRIFSAELDGTPFITTAARAGLPSWSVMQLHEISGSEQNGIIVRVMRNEDGRYTTLSCRGVRWLFGGLDATAPGAVPLLIDVANAVADGC